MANTIQDLLKKYPESGLAREAVDDLPAVFVVMDEDEGFQTYVNEDDQEAIDFLMAPRKEAVDGPSENKSE